MENKKFIVYEHLFLNGKRYIGITCKKPNERWENGSGYNKDNQSAVYNAIKKYGWNNIQHNILFSNLTKEEAQQKEIELIAFYKTNCRRYKDANGYNMTDGGEGTLGHLAGENVARANRERMTGRTGKDCPNSRSVYCDGIIFESLTQWREYYNNPKGNINAWLNGKVSMPKYWYDKNFHYIDIGFDIVKCREKESYRVTIDGIVFDTQAELAKYIGYKPAAVCDWLSGKHKVPQEIIDRGFNYVDREKVSFIPQDVSPSNKVEYDGIIYDSQAKLARHLGINPTSIMNYLRGKIKIPEQYKDKGLKYVK